MMKRPAVVALGVLLLGASFGTVASEEPGGRSCSPDLTLPTAAPWNVPRKALTPTYDGSGQAVHPSVLDFNQIVGGPWNGWRYWMVMTPHTDTLSSRENPSIIVSNDGCRWSQPHGIVNPLYKPPPTRGSFLSDPHLQYDPGSDELVMVYRVYDGATRLHTPHIVRSSNGVDWPAVSSGIEFTRSEQILSPTLVRVSASEWHLYGITRDTREFQRWASSDLMTWQGPTDLIGLDSVSHPWHLDVLYHEGRFWMLVDRGPRYLGHADGYRAAASMDGLTWAVGESDFMESNHAHRWESAQLYRASIQPHEDGIHLRMWYSAEGPPNKWWTGFTQVRRDVWPAPPS